MLNTDQQIFGFWLSVSSMICKSSDTFQKGLLYQEADQNLCWYFMYQKKLWQWVVPLPFLSSALKEVWHNLSQNDNGEVSWVRKINLFQIWRFNNIFLYRDLARW